MLNLKSLEITNFKSYKSKNVIPIESHFTCIIGTNGSGKSNILDAIIFCLEPGSKSIRVDNVKSLINSGIFCSVKVSLVGNMSGNNVNGTSGNNMNGTSGNNMNGTSGNMNDGNNMNCSNMNDVNTDNDNGNERVSIYNNEQSDSTLYNNTTTHNNNTHNNNTYEFTRHLNINGKSTYFYNNKKVSYELYMSTLSSLGINNFIIYQSASDFNITTMLEELSGSIKYKEEYKIVKTEYNELVNKLKIENENKRQFMNLLKENQKCEEEQKRITKLFERKKEIENQLFDYKIYKLVTEYKRLKQIDTSTIPFDYTKYNKLRNAYNKFEQDIHRVSVIQKHNTEIRMKIEEKKEMLNYINEEIQKCSTKYKKIEGFEGLEKRYLKEVYDSSVQGGVDSTSRIEHGGNTHGRTNGTGNTSMHHGGNTHDNTNGTTENTHTNGTDTHDYTNTHTRSNTLQTIDTNDKLKIKLEKAVNEKHKLEKSNTTRIQEYEQLLRQEEEYTRKLNDMNNTILLNKNIKLKNIKIYNVKNRLRNIKGVIGFIKDLIKCTNNKYNTSIHSLLCKYEYGVVVQDEDTSLVCIQYCKDNKLGRITCFIETKMKNIEKSVHGSSSVHEKGNETSYYKEQGIVEQKDNELHRDGVLQKDNELQREGVLQKDSESQRDGVLQKDKQLHEDRQLHKDSAFQKDTQLHKDKLHRDTPTHGVSPLLVCEYPPHITNIVHFTFKNTLIYDSLEEGYKKISENSNYNICTLDGIIIRNKGRIINMNKTQYKECDMDDDILNNRVVVINKLNDIKTQKLKYSNLEAITSRINKLEKDITEYKKTIQKIETQNNHNSIIRRIENKIFNDMFIKNGYINYNDYVNKNSKYYNEEMNIKKQVYENKKKNVLKEIEVLQNREQSYDDILINENIRNDYMKICEEKKEYELRRRNKSSIDKEIDRIVEEIKDAYFIEKNVVVSNGVKDVSYGDSSSMKDGVLDRKDGVVDRSDGMNNSVSDVINMDSKDDHDTNNNMNNGDSTANNNINNDNMNNTDITISNTIPLHTILNLQIHNYNKDMLEQELRSINTTLSDITPIIKNTIKDKYKIERYDKIKHKTIQAKDNLNKLRNKMRDIFMECFNILNESINELYIKILDGTCNLVVENKDEPYNSNIKYYIMVPNKKYREYENLSGGEKMISRLMLMYSIYKYKMSRYKKSISFILLDEVDSNLDNYNVHRLVDFIRQESLQVLMVSLKLGVYKCSDDMIGVYKKEGLSRLLYYRFQ